MRRTTLLFSLAVVAAVAVILARRLPRPAPPPPARFESVPRPVIGESSNPQLAFATNDTLYLLATAPAAAGNRLILALSHDGGDSFTPPLEVSLPGATVMDHGEMAPVLRAKGEGVFALWQQTTPTAGSQIIVARSTNSGKTFAPPLPIVVKPTPSFNGFANLSLSPKGDLYAVWLDGRDAHRTQGTFDVYLAKSTDRGATWSANVLVAPQSCPCCRPAVAADDHGDVYVAYRKVYPGDQRDLALSVSHDGGQTFAPPLRVASERWTLHACPESGPSLALRPNGQVIAAWYSGAGLPGIRIAVSDPSVTTFHVAAVPQSVLDQNHPELSLSEDGDLWLAFQGRQALARNVWPPLTPFLAAVAPDGSVSAPVAASGGAISGYPALAAASAGRLFLASPQEAMGHDQVMLIRARAAN